MIDKLMTKILFTVALLILLKVSFSCSRNGIEDIPDIVENSTPEIVVGFYRYMTILPPPEEYQYTIRCNSDSVVFRKKKWSTKDDEATLHLTSDQRTRLDSLINGMPYFGAHFDRHLFDTIGIIVLIDGASVYAHWNFKWNNLPAEIKELISLLLNEEPIETIYLNGDWSVPPKKVSGGA